MSEQQSVDRVLLLLHITLHDELRRCNTETQSIAYDVQNRTDTDMASLLQRYNAGAPSSSCRNSITVRLSADYTLPQTQLLSHWAHEVVSLLAAAIHPFLSPAEGANHTTASSQRLATLLCRHPAIDSATRAEEQQPLQNAQAACAPHTPPKQHQKNMKGRTTWSPPSLTFGNGHKEERKERQKEGVENR